MSAILAVALGGAAGVVVLLGAVTVLVVLCLRHRRRTSDSSESNSSGPTISGTAEITFQEAVNFSIFQLVLNYDFSLTNCFLYIRQARGKMHDTGGTTLCYK